MVGSEIQISMYRLDLGGIGPLRKAHLEFGDLTVFVGPQASGKSVALQWLKLVQDIGLIQEELKTYGIDYDRDLSKFLEVYFGEGMSSIWNSKSIISVDGSQINLANLIARKQRQKKNSVFLIPAQRVMAFANGWPRPFQDYGPRDPYVVRAYSEELRRLVEQEFGRQEALFPKANRLKVEYRKLLQQAVFAKFSLEVDFEPIQKRLVLRRGRSRLPYMVWSAGQRELVPLLLGLYWLMPPSKVSKRKDIDWVVIEEPEMGLHPRAVSVLLLIVLELLTRGYRVCLSTHSTQVLELAWAFEALRANRGTPTDLLSVFGIADPTQALRNMATKALKKKTRVFYFNHRGVAEDITELKLDDVGRPIWGGLLDFSGQANAAVARAAANAVSK